MTEIGDEVFREKDIESVKMPSTVKTIGHGAFEDCKKMRSVTIPEGVTFIDDWAFGYCTNLESVIIPASVGYIGKYAFGFCDKLTSVRFGDLGVAIKEYAFAHCTSVEDFPFEQFSPEEYMDIFAEGVPLDIIVRVVTSPIFYSLEFRREWIEYLFNDIDDRDRDRVLNELTRYLTKREIDEMYAISQEPYKRP